MNARALVAWALLGLVHRTSSMVQQQRTRPSAPGRLCPRLQTLLGIMWANPEDPVVQATGCSSLVGCFSTAEQHKAVEAGVIETAIGAQQRFPDDMQVQVPCTQAVGLSISGNHRFSSRAGEMGGLNLSLAAYRRWQDDPEVASLGGAIGAYFGRAPQNHAIVRELGGLKLFVQTVKDNFHGRVSNWTPRPVTQALTALSTACWWNEDLCSELGLLQLATDVLREHNEAGIRETALNVMVPLIWISDDHRHRFVADGGAEVVLAALREGLGTPETIHAACTVVSLLIGPAGMREPHDTGRTLPFDSGIQRHLTKAGAVGVLLRTLLPQRRPKLQDRPSSFRRAHSEDRRASEGHDTGCVLAAGSMAAYWTGRNNADIMIHAGLAAELQERAQRGSRETDEWKQACHTLFVLATQNQSVTTC